MLGNVQIMFVWNNESSVTINTSNTETEIMLLSIYRFHVMNAEVFTEGPARCVFVSSLVTG